MILTGFSASELEATGLVAHYHSLLSAEVGPAVLDGFIGALLAAPDPAAAVGDPAVRELASALTHLWYLGVWPGSVPFVASPAAYAEGLVWKAFHGAPPGTVAPGFGSWARPPRGGTA